MDPATPEQPKVFVSYSRKDLDFAGQLVLALEDRGFDAIVDSQDIDAAEAWKDRLGDLLLRCDSVVFVLSEHSAASSVCAWEVDEAVRLNKRTIPVVPAPFSGATPPAALADLNWIHFYTDERVPGSGFYDGVMKLERALKVDLDWLREATRLLEAAADWTASGHHEDRLLRGAALEEALQWRLGTRGDNQVHPDIAVYLDESEAAELRRKAAAEADLEERQRALSEREAAVAAEQAALEQKARAEAALRDAEVNAAREREQAARRIATRTRLGLAAALMLTLLAVVAGGIAAIQAREAEAQRVIAVAAEDDAIEALHAAEVNASRFVASEARKALMSGDSKKALAIGLAAMLPPDEAGEGRTPSEAQWALRSAVLAASSRPLVGHEYGIHASHFSPDSQFVLTGSSDATARIWSVETASTTAELKAHKEWVGAVAFSPSGTAVLTGGFDDRGILWNRTADGDWKVQKIFEDFSDDVDAVAFTPDSGSAVMGSQDQAIRIVKIPDPPTEPWKRIYEYSELGAATTEIQFSPDGELMISAAGSDIFVRGSAESGFANLLSQAYVTGPASIEMIAVAPDSRFMLMAYDNERVDIWVRPAEPKQPWKTVRTLKGHVGPVTFAAVDPTGTFIYTGSRDDTLIRVWKRATADEHSWIEVVAWPTHTDLLYTAALSPNGKHIVTGSVDAVGRLWSLEPLTWPLEKVVAEAERLLGDTDPLPLSDRCRLGLIDEDECP